PYTRRPTPKKPISSVNARNSRRTTRASARSWRQSTSPGGSIRRWRNRWSNNSWHMTRSALMRAMNSASLRPSARVRFRPHWRLPAAFAVGAAMPLLVAALAPEKGLIFLVAGTSLAFLALLGALAAHTGGAGMAAGALRVTFWGALAMAVTAGVGALFGTVA